MAELPRQENPVVGQQQGMSQQPSTPIQNLKPIPQTQQNQVPAEEKKSKKWVWITVVILAIIVGVYFYFFR